MKNMATNQKLILLMLLTACLTCWVQSVSHGGGGGGGVVGAVGGAVGGALGAAGGAVGTGLGAVGTALGAAGTAIGTAVGLTVGILADAVELTVGVVGLTVELTASIVLLPAYGIASDTVIFPNGVVGILSSNYINLWSPDKLGFIAEFSHGSHLNSIAVHPGGGTFASGSADNNIQFWNLQTESLDATLQGHTDTVLSVAFSPDGALLASGSADDTVRLWNPDTETLQATLREHTDNVLSIAFSPDGSLFASGSADATVRLWDPFTETLRATLEAHLDTVLSVAFNPDGALLASASADGLVGLWDPNTETLQATLGHESPVLSVAFSPDGDLLATGSTDGTARLWDPHRMKVIATLGHESPVRNVTFGPDGNTLITGSEDGTVRQWKITISPDGIRDTNEPLRTFTGSEGDVNSVVFSPDGQTLAGGSNDNTVRLWDANTGEPLRALTGSEGDVNSVVFSPDGQTLASGSGGGLSGSLRLWHADTGVLLRELTTRSNLFSPLESGSAVNSVAFSPDGQTLASGGGSAFSSFIRLWDVKTGALLRELTTSSSSFLPFEPGSAVNSVVFSPDGQTLASGSGTGTVRVWDANIGGLLREFTTGANRNLPFEPGSAVNSVTFSPDGQTLASGSDDNTVRLWNTNTGESLGILTGHKSDVNSVAFSPDGRMIVSGSDDDTVRLWDANTGEYLRIFTGPEADVNSVAFSPDGRMIAGGSNDNTVHLWEITPKTITPNTTVSLLPASVQSPAVGNHLTLNLTITGGLNVAGYQATVQFDTTALRYVEGINGDYLRDTAFFATPVVDENRVTFSATSLAGETKGDGTLATLTFEVVSAKASTLTLSEVNLVNSVGEKTRPKVEGAQITEPALDADVNGDGSVDAQDLVVVQDRLGQTRPNSADVNGDGIVDIADLTLVAGAIGSGAAAPSLYPQLLREFTVADVKLWLSQAQRLDLTNPRIQKGILFLEQLLAALLPKETILLPNYPNPFNPETWIPYRLAEDAFVTLTIYDSAGRVVRTLEVGHRIAAFYESRSKAIYWDGRNEFGEQVASGVYFYHLFAGDYSATRKMLILK